MKNINNKLFRRCIKIAHKSLDLPTSHNKHFSFLIFRNKILSFGYALGYTSHTLAYKYKYRFNSIHSELKCLIEFPRPPLFLKKCTLINIRIMSDGTIGMSKPCPKCQQLLKDFGISKVYFSNRDGFFEEIIII
jgi:hypothetical protein